MPTKSHDAACLIAVAFLIVGCSSAADKMLGARERAQQAYDQAQQEFTNKNYAAAKENFAVAAAPEGGLNGDLLADATIKLAVCTAHEGGLDQAISLLDQAKAGGVPPDLELAARAYVLAKQGKAAESRAALAKARQYNRTVQEFKD